MIMGASGSGKTTLLNLIGCLDHPSSGSYIFDGKPIDSLSDKDLSRLRGREIGFVFQSFNLLPRFPAWRNVELPLVYQRIPSSVRRKTVQKVLDQVGLNGKSHRKPSELSGGEQQRVAIARALSVNPSLLLADEPTGNLDSNTGAEIMKIIKNLHETGMTIVMVTHAPELVSFADRIVFLKDGRIAQKVN